MAKRKPVEEEQTDGERIAEVLTDALNTLIDEGRIRLPRSRAGTIARRLVTALSLYLALRQ
jgi:hypothetical protein